MIRTTDYSRECSSVGKCANVKLVERKGPTQGANVYFTFEI